MTILVEQQALDFEVVKLVLNTKTPNNTIEMILKFDRDDKRTNLRVPYLPLLPVPSSTWLTQITEEHICNMLDAVDISVEDVKWSEKEYPEGLNGFKGSGNNYDTNLDHIL